MEYVDIFYATALRSRYSLEETRGALVYRAVGRGSTSPPLQRQAR